MKKYKNAYQRVDFDIRGNSLNPEKITELLGIQPDDSWKKNDIIMFDGKKVKNARTGRCRKNKIGVWALESNAGKRNSLEDKINYLVNKLLPVKEKLKKVNTKYTKMLYITIEPHYDIAVFCVPISLKLIKTLSILGIEIELNIDMPHQFKKYHKKLARIPKKNK
jgi:hypothetical protein